MARRLAISAVALVILLMALSTAVLTTEKGYAAVSLAWGKLRCGYTVEERIAMHSSAVETRMKAKFEAAEVHFPPAELAYVAFKDTAKLQIYARSNRIDRFRLVHTYPVLGMSGGLGPKLRRGDRQVPEGIYRAEFLNANSRFHLSIRLNYPNEFDRDQAKSEGRSDLGSDIMIHGTSASVGCLAMGNEAAEDLFILAALTGKENVEIIVAPTDFRQVPVRRPDGSPVWLSVLYNQIKVALNRFPSEA